MLKVILGAGNPSEVIKVEGSLTQILLDLIEVITAIHARIRCENPDLADGFRTALINCLQMDGTWTVREAKVNE